MNTKTSIDQAHGGAWKQRLRTIRSFLIFPLILFFLGTGIVQAEDQTDDRTGSTPATPAAANPAVDGTAGAAALAQTQNPNAPPSRSVAKGQNGGNGGDSSGGTLGGKGGAGGAATAIAQSNVPGVVTAMATGGIGGTGGAGTPGGAGGDGGKAKAQATGKSDSANAEAIGGAGGLGVSSTPGGGANGAGGRGGNAEALLDVQDSGQKVMGRAVGGAGGDGGSGGAKDGVKGDGGNATVTAKKVVMTGANDVEINLEARGGAGGNLGGSATNILEGSTTQAGKLTIKTAGGSGLVKSGNSSTTVNFTAQKNLTIDGSSTIAAVSKNPAGFGGDSTVNNYTLNSTAGDVSGKVTVQGGPVVNARMGTGGNAAANVSAMAAGDITLELHVAAGWGGRSGGDANAVLVGASPNGNLDLFGGARGGSGDSKGVGTSKVTGTGKRGTVEAAAQSGIGGDQPNPVKKPVKGLKAVTAEAKAPVNGRASAESETGIGTPTALVGLTTPQAAAIVSGAPLSADVLRETTGSPNVLQQVVLGRNVLGLAGLGASYPDEGDGTSGTSTASATFEIDPSQFAQDGLLRVGLFHPMFNGPDFENVTFDILGNGAVLEHQVFTDEALLLKYFNDNVLTFKPTTSAGSDFVLDFEYSYTANEAKSGFGFGLVFSTPEQGGLMTPLVAAASLCLAGRWFRRASSLAATGT